MQNFIKILKKSLSARPTVQGIMRLLDEMALDLHFPRWSREMQV